MLDESLNWSRWYSGEPNGGNNENHIMLVPLSNSWHLSDYWNDAHETGDEIDSDITVICVKENPKGIHILSSSS